MEDKNNDTYSLKPNTLLRNGYVIRKKIGEGGFGIIYLAEDANLSHKVVIKELFPKKIAYRLRPNSSISLFKGKENVFQDLIEGFKNEARILDKLRNVSDVVNYISYFSENSTEYIVMEYIEGCTLKKFKRQLCSYYTPIQIFILLNCTSQILKVLEKIHENDIVHCDISLNNLMITVDGSIKIIDFGCAVDLSTSYRLFAGNKIGAAPEQKNDTGKIGPWTDVYSICTLLNTILRKTKKNIFMFYFNKAISKGLIIDCNFRLQSAKALYNEIYSEMPHKLIKYYIKTRVTYLASLLLAMTLLIGDTRIVQKDNDYNIDNNILGKETGSVNKNVVNTNNRNITTTSGLRESKSTYSNEEKTVQEKEISGATVRYKILDNHIEIIGIDAEVTEFTVPDIIDDYPVTAIQSIEGNITSLILPEGIEKIESNAFRRCYYLESIELPSTLKEIGTNAFENCPLKLITIPEANSYFYTNEEKTSLYSKESGKLIYEYK